jgi:hypothetical protein
MEDNGRIVAIVIGVALGALCVAGWAYGNHVLTTSEVGGRLVFGGDYYLTEPRVINEQYPDFQIVEHTPCVYENIITWTNQVSKGTYNIVIYNIESNNYSTLPTVFDGGNFWSANTDELMTYLSRDGSSSVVRDWNGCGIGQDSFQIAHYSGEQTTPLAPDIDGDISVFGWWTENVALSETVSLYCFTNDTLWNITVPITIGDRTFEKIYQPHIWKDRLVVWLQDTPSDVESYLGVYDIESNTWEYINNTAGDFFNYIAGYEDGKILCHTVDGEEIEYGYQIFTDEGEVLYTNRSSDENLNPIGLYLDGEMVLSAVTNQLEQTNTVYLTRYESDESVTLAVAGIESTNLYGHNVYRLTNGTYEIVYDNDGNLTLQFLIPPEEATNYINRDVQILTERDEVEARDDFLLLIGCIILASTAAYAYWSKDYGSYRED